MGYTDAQQAAMYFARKRRRIAAIAASAVDLIGGFFDNGHFDTSYFGDGYFY